MMTKLRTSLNPLLHEQVVLEVITIGLSFVAIQLTYNSLVSTFNRFAPQTTPRGGLRREGLLCMTLERRGEAISPEEGGPEEYNKDLSFR